MYAWSKAFILPYESSWSLFQKITCLHSTRPLILLRDISPSRINIHGPSIVGEGEWCSFEDTCWMRYPRRRTASLPPVSEAGLVIHDELFRHGGQIYFGNLAARVLATSLQICPICIEEGYHCIAHQIAGLSRCPIHEAELTSKCPLCDGYLGAFSLSGRFHSFRCPECQGRLLKEDFVPRLVTFADQIFVKIQPLIAWINSFSKESISWPFVYRETRRHQIGGVPENVDTLSRGLLWCLHRLKPFDSACAWFGSEIASLSLLHVNHADYFGRRRARGHDLPRRDMQHREDQTLACLRNVIQEVRTSLVEKIGAHSRCCELLTHLLSPYSRGLEKHFVSPGKEYCGLAQAVDLWELHLKAGLEYMKQDIRMGWWPEMNETFLEIARRDVTSLFYLSAQDIANYQNLRSVSPTHRYETFDLRTRPMFSLNGEYAHCGGGQSQNGTRLLLFSFQEEAILDQFRCDRGKMMGEKLERTVTMINAVRQSVAEHAPVREGECFGAKRRARSKRKAS